MIPALLAKIGVPVLGAILADAIGEIEHPAAKTAAKALSELDDIFMKGQLSNEQIAEANRHTEKMAEMRIKESAAAYSEINKSLRAEVTSDDKYVRRMRPTFGYLMAATWAAQMFGVAYIMVFRTDHAAVVMQAVESLSMIWTVGLSVLGIYVYKRSEEKKEGV
ncbi:MAG: ribokinase [Proteobacteria bacterium]|nr:ribokinase [Pseudomonadota bacterium]